MVETHSFDIFPIYDFLYSVGFFVESPCFLESFCRFALRQPLCAWIDFSSPTLNRHAHLMLSRITHDRYHALTSPSAPEESGSRSHPCEPIPTMVFTLFCPFPLRGRRIVDDFTLQWFSHLVLFGVSHPQFLVIVVIYFLFGESMLLRSR